MNELIEYVRNKNREPIGVVVALGKNQVGWSRKHNLDKWNREKALRIARGRAIVGSGETVTIPYDVLPIMEHMIDRSQRYFK